MFSCVPRNHPEIIYPYMIMTCDDAFTYLVLLLYATPVHSQRPQTNVLLCCTIHQVPITDYKDFLYFTVLSRVAVQVIEVAPFRRMLLSYECWWWPHFKWATTQAK